MHYIKKLSSGKIIFSKSKGRDITLIKCQNLYIHKLILLGILMTMVITYKYMILITNKGKVQS